jgi:hypothetical protein
LTRKTVAWPSVVSALAAFGETLVAAVYACYKVNEARTASGRLAVAVMGPLMVVGVVVAFVKIRQATGPEILPQALVCLPRRLPRNRSRI